MNQNASFPVLDLVGIDISPDICAYLTALLHQTLAGTVEPRSHVVLSSWDAQGKDVFLVQTVFVAMTAALDAYTDLVVAHLSVLGRVAAGHSPRGGYSGEATCLARRSGEGNAPGWRWPSVSRPIPRLQHNAGVQAVHVSKQGESSLAERVLAFLENRWKDVDAIAAALDHANYENVRILGHNMQGAGTSYGFHRIAEIGASLEQAARHRESEEIRAQAVELARYLIRLHGAMDS